MSDRAASTGSSFAVTWAEQGRRPVEGRIQVGLHAIGFSGGDEASAGVRREIPYRELTGIETASAAAGPPDAGVLVLRRAAGDVVIRGSETHLALQELAERLADLDLGTARRAVVVVPLRDGAAARRLVDEGPPFDPADVPLVRHEVFLTDREAVFVFEARTGAALHALIANLDVWATAAAWRDVAAGPPRLGQIGYSWRGAESIAGLGF